jgi:hypothetical protein
MPLVFVLARDWTLRTAVRAELRERGIDARGMDSADDVGRAIVAALPAVLVVEGISEFPSNAAIRNLTARIPTVWIASRTEKIPLPAPSAQTGPPNQRVGVVLYRPVRIAEIVSSVLDLLHKAQPA